MNNNESSLETSTPDELKELVGRRHFLQSMGKWSAAAIAAAVVGSAWFAFPPEANAGGAWVNRRGGYGGGGWINGRGGWGGGGGWLNHGGGGGAWVNRRYYGGGGAWINRW
jgi:hypothetical protein